MWGKFFKKIICSFALMAFTATSVVPPTYAQSVIDLPQAGSMVNLSQGFAPVVLRGIKVDPQDPFKFEFVLDPGQSKLEGDALKDESTRLIRYFLASVTTPEKDLWVNLSPYEQDRIIPEAFGTTEMGRDLLAQDYILKQVTSSLMYPDGETGKAFWQKVYAKAYDAYGTTDVPVDTFNKVWIAPDMAEVYEDNGVAFIGESHLKVLLESDYMAADKTHVEASAQQSGAETQEMTKEIIREVMLPVIEREVNEGRNFAQLRQVYQSLILAAWYKKRLKDSVLNKVYADRNKVSGVDIEDKKESEKIWAQYVDAFKKGAYNYIKEEYDQYTQELIPRKYFSGGMNMDMSQAIESKPMESIPRGLSGVTKFLLLTIALMGANLGVLGQEKHKVLGNKKDLRKDKPEESLNSDVEKQELVDVKAWIEGVDAIDLLESASVFLKYSDAVERKVMTCSRADILNHADQLISFSWAGDLIEMKVKEALDSNKAQEIVFAAHGLRGYEQGVQDSVKNVAETQSLVDLFTYFKGYPWLMELVLKKATAADVSADDLVKAASLNEVIQLKDTARVFFDVFKANAMEASASVVLDELYSLLLWNDQFPNDPFIVDLIRSKLPEATPDWILNNADILLTLFPESAEERVLQAISFAQGEWVVAYANRFSGYSPEVSNRVQQKAIELALANPDALLDYMDQIKIYGDVWVSEVFSHVDLEKLLDLDWKLDGETWFPGLLKAKLEGLSADAFVSRSNRFRELIINDSDFREGLFKQQLENATASALLPVAMDLMEFMEYERPGQNDWIVSLVLDKARTGEASADDIFSRADFFWTYGGEEGLNMLKQEGRVVSYYAVMSHVSDSRLRLGSRLSFVDEAWFKKKLVESMERAGSWDVISSILDLTDYYKDPEIVLTLKGKIKSASAKEFLDYFDALTIFADETGQEKTWLMELVFQKVQTESPNRVFDYVDLLLRDEGYQARGFEILEKNASQAGFHALVPYVLNRTLKSQAWFMENLQREMGKASPEAVVQEFRGIDQWYLLDELDTQDSIILGLLKSKAKQVSLFSLTSLFIRSDDEGLEWLKELMNEKIEQSEEIDFFRALEYLPRRIDFSVSVKERAGRMSSTFFFYGAPMLKFYDWFGELLSIKAQEADPWDVMGFNNQIPGLLSEDLLKEKEREYYSVYFDVNNTPQEAFWEKVVPSLEGSPVFIRVEAIRSSMNWIRSGLGEIILDGLTEKLADKLGAVDLNDGAFSSIVVLTEQYYAKAHSQGNRDVSGVYYINAMRIASVIVDKLNEPVYAQDPVADSLRQVVRVLISNCKEALYGTAKEQQAPALFIEEVERNAALENSFTVEEDHQIGIIEGLLDAPMQRLKSNEPLSREDYQGMIALVQELRTGSQRLEDLGLTDTALMRLAADNLAVRVAYDLSKKNKEGVVDKQVFEDLKGTLEKLDYNIDVTQSDVQKLIRSLLDDQLGYVAGKLIRRYSDLTNKHTTALLLLALLAGLSLLKLGRGSRHKKTMLAAWLALAGATATLTPAVVRDIRALLEEPEVEVLDVQGPGDSPAIDTVPAGVQEETGVLTGKDTGKVTEDIVPDSIFRGNIYRSKGYTLKPSEKEFIPNKNVQILDMFNKKGEFVAKVIKVIHVDGSAGFKLLGKPGEQGEDGGVSADDLKRALPQGFEIIFDAPVAESSLGGKPNTPMAQDGVIISNMMNGTQGLLVNYPDGRMKIVNIFDMKPSDLTDGVDGVNDLRLDLTKQRDYMTFVKIVRDKEMGFVGSMLIAYKGKVAKFRDQGTDRRRAVCYYKDGSFAFLEPKEDMTLDGLAKLAVESGSKDNPLVAAVYCDTGYMDFATLRFLNVDGARDSIFFGHKDARQSNNRGGIYYKAEDPDTIAFYRPSQAVGQERPFARLHLDVLRGKQIVGVVSQDSFTGKKASVPAGLYDEDGFLSAAVRAIARNEDLAVFVKDPDGKRRIEKFITFDASQSTPVDQAGVIDGGIDLDIGKLNLNIKGDGSAAINALDPAMLAQFEAAPGLVPVIISITPANNLPAFLGLSYADDPEPSQATG